MKPEHTQLMMLALVKPVAKYLLLGFMFMLLVVGLQLWLPYLTGTFIDQQIVNQSGSELTQATLFLAVLAACYAAVNSVRFYLFDVAGNKIVINLRRKLFAHLLQQEMDFFDQHKSGELTSRLTSDVEAIKDILTTQIAILLRTLVVSIGGLGLLFYLSWQMTLLMLVVIPMSATLGKWMGAKVHGNSKTLQNNIARGLDLANESLVNIRLVKVFNKHAVVNQKYRTATENVLSASVRQGALFAWFQAGSTMITYSALILILFAGGHLVIAGNISVGELTSFVLYASMTSMSIAGVLGFWAEWKQARGASERIFEILARQPVMKRRVIEKGALTEMSGQLRFSDVSFSYPQRPEDKAISGVSFSLAPGEVAAFVGASGAGKSTIASLILGLYEPDAGNIQFDGQDYYCVDKDTLSANIAVVEQEPKLFSGSIAHNIGLGSQQDEIDLAAIKRAAQKANADEFISQFKDGYQTEVGQNGVQLSGGQKQRIAIARAILRDPKLLILDEATSALDAESEQSVQAALQTLMKGRTTIIIAHRLSTILGADKIFVMQQGQIVQTGNHSELIRQENGQYAALIAAQTTADAA